MNYDVIIIGAGIIGLSTALQLLQRQPQLKVALLEKETRLAYHQTGHNSGVIHAGVYYPPGSMKAKFCIAGCRAVKQFCTEQQIPYREVGKIIAAVNETELVWMQALANRCEQNGLTVQTLTADEARVMQPGLVSMGALFVKETGIVDFKQVCQKYAELFMRLGGKIFYQQTVCGIYESANSVTLHTTAQHSYQCGYVVACAGVYADRLVKCAGLKPNFRIIPFRGEYYKLSEQYTNYFQHAIYPVPNPKLPFLGVHFTPQISGLTTVGPNAVLALAREGYRWRDISWRDSYEIFSYFPVWKMLARHFKATIHEIRGSLSKNYYLQLMQQYFPQIRNIDLAPYPAGVRAQAIDHAGNLINDFLFMQSARILHTCNAPSPAATSSLPIGQYIVDKLLESVIQC